MLATLDADEPVPGDRERRAIRHVAAEPDDRHGLRVVGGERELRVAERSVAGCLGDERHPEQWTVGLEHGDHCVRRRRGRGIGAARACTGEQGESDYDRRETAPAYELAIAHGSPSWARVGGP